MEGFGGKTALVVGGSGGIGREISLALAGAGASVIVHGGRESPRFDSLMERMAALGSGGTPRKLVFFITPDAAALESSVLYKAAQNCDILCVCFGPFLRAPLDQTSPQDWQRIVFCNYTLPGILVSACLPRLRGQRWGRILLFGGTNTQAVRGFRTNPCYGGAKTGISSLVQSAACEYGGEGITCNALIPGFVDTEYLNPPEREALKAKIPGGELLSPQQVAQTALFVLSRPEINGALINIDRGWRPG